MFILGIRIFCQNSQSGVNSSRVPPPPYPPPAHEKTVLQLSDFLSLPDAPSLFENVHVWSNKNSTMLQNQYADLLEDAYFKKCWVKEKQKMQGAWIIPDHVPKVNLANLSRGQRILPPKNIFWRGAGLWKSLVDWSPLSLGGHSSFPWTFTNNFSPPKVLPLEKRNHRP